MSSWSVLCTYTDVKHCDQTTKMHGIVKSNNNKVLIINLRN